MIAKQPARKIIQLACLYGVSAGIFAACNQTLSPGADLVKAVSAAANGSTICLNPGQYGRINFYDISRTGYVTLQSATEKSASIAPHIGNSDYIILSSLTLGDVVQNSCSTHIKWLNNDFPTSSLTLSNSACGNIDTQIDNNSFTAYNVDGGYEGRLSLAYGSGISVTNNFFGGGGASDGIQLIANVKDVTIAGNQFDGILESLCGAVHCDAIQLYGAGTGIVIENNLFTKGDTFIMAPDGSSGVIVRNNVFNGNGVSYEYKIQFGSAAGLQFYNNTLHNAAVAIDSKVGASASINAVVKNNILTGFSKWKTIGGSGCTSCSFTFNLYDDVASTTGSSNIVGIPTFNGGGVAPATWAGWQLTTASVGNNAGDNGIDVGANYFGLGGQVFLDPPSFLHVK